MTSPVELLRVGPLNAAAAILGTTTLVTMTTLGFAILPAAITCVVRVSVSPSACEFRSSAASNTSPSRLG